MDGDHTPFMLKSLQDEPSTIDSFDESDYVDSHESSHRPVALESRIPNHLLLVSLLESLVEAYEKDPTRKKRMFRVICKHLDDMNVIPSWEFIENFSSIRAQYSSIVHNMMVAITKMMDRQVSSKFLSLPSTADERSYALLQAGTDPLSPRTPEIRTEEVLKSHNSRYKTEFKEIEKIGKGGFGSVYKVKNKLDQREYAVKKILLKQKHPESARKVLREVQLLAILDHANIVRYNAAWIEAEPVSPPKAQIWTLPTDDISEARFTRSNSHEGISQSPPNILTKPNIQSPPTNTSTLTAKTVRPSNVHSPPKVPSRTRTAPPTVIKAPPGAGYLQPRYPPGYQLPWMEKSDLNSNSFMAPNITELEDEIGYDERNKTECSVQNGHKSDGSDPSKSGDSLDNLLSCNGMSATSFQSSSRTSQMVLDNNCDEPTSNCDFEESDFKFTASSSACAKYEADSDFSDLSIRFENSTHMESSVMNSEHITSKVQSEKVDFKFKHVSSKNVTEASLKVEKKTEIKNSGMEVCRRNPGSLLSYYNGTLLSGHFGLRNLSRKSNRDKQKDPPKRDASNSRLDRNGDFDYANRLQQMRRRAVSFDPSTDMSRGEMDLGVVNTGGNLFAGLAVTLYIQMQLCSRTLAGWLKERNERLTSLPDSFGGVEPAVNMQIFEGIMKGVKYIHTNGFMHRDLKPKNIFLDGDHLHVRIGDFGLARHDIVERSKDEDYPLTPLVPVNKWDFSSNYSMHTSGVGTATYASPEQLSGNEYNSKSDMYSAGIILFELFHPFSTGMERARCMGDLRRGRIATEVMSRWPLQSAMMEELVAFDGKDRPSADEVLQNVLFVSKDEMISRLQTQLTEQSKMLSQKVQEVIERTAELRDARQLLKEKDDLIYELLENNSR